MQKAAVQALITTIVSEQPGIKATALAVALVKHSNEGLKGDFNLPEWMDWVEEMARQGALVAVEYILPDTHPEVAVPYTVRRAKSMYFPKGTEVRH